MVHLDRAARLLRLATAPLRCLPDFVILGTQRGGTTFLHACLERHPDVHTASRKEVHFYDSNFALGLPWYRSFFPLTGSVRAGQRVGEATPAYLYHPRAAALLAETLPKARFIVLLRNPILRAYSHHSWVRGRGEETLSFAAALACETERLARDRQQSLRSPYVMGHHHRLHSYVDRGRYAVQLQEYWRHFPRERFLILKSEDLYTSPRTVLREVLGFLDLRALDIEPAGGFNSARYTEPLDQGLRIELAEMFRVPNQELYRLLGRDLGWEG